jgi:hypothetical protein
VLWDVFGDFRITTVRVFSLAQCIIQLARFSFMICNFNGGAYRVCVLASYPITMAYFLTAYLEEMKPLNKLGWSSSTYSKVSIVQSEQYSYLVIHRSAESEYT